MALKKGDRVKVYNTTYGGEQIFEGLATVLRKTDVMDRYLVHFDNDPKGDNVHRFLQEENKIN